MAESPTRRWLSLDVFRGLAVIWMVQGHTFTLLARPEEVAQAFGPAYRLGHGLTAPMFLLGGGLAYGFVTLREAARPDTARLLRRGLLLIAIGYLLNLPRASIAAILASPVLEKAAAVVGPLQLVGVCLLSCELCRWWLPSRGARIVAVALLALASSVLAPPVWQAHGSQASVWLGGWLDGYAGSQFPFFPWAAFFYAGLLCAAPVLGLRERMRRSASGSIIKSGGEARLGGALLLSGLCISATCYELYASGCTLRALYGDHDLWHTSPLYVAFRIGAVVVVLGSLALCEPLIAWAFARAPRAAGLFGALSRQSLVAYVVHLLILYGSPVSKGLKVLGKLELSECFLVFAGVLVLTTAVSVGFEWLETSRSVPRVRAWLERAGSSPERSSQLRG